jgi:hypothetical protein
LKLNLNTRGIIIKIVVSYFLKFCILRMYLCVSLNCFCFLYMSDIHAHAISTHTNKKKTTVTRKTEI